MLRWASVLRFGQTFKDIDPRGSFPEWESSIDISSSAIKSPYSVASGVPGDFQVDCLSRADCHPTAALRRLELLAGNQLKIANAAYATLPSSGALCSREFRPTPGDIAKKTQ